MQRLLSIADRLSSLAVQENDRILCYYKNSTDQIQVARSTNATEWHFERVIFPGEQLLFEALPEAELEIHMGTVGEESVDRTICSHLRVND